MGSAIPSSSSYYGEFLAYKERHPEEVHRLRGYIRSRLRQVPSPDQNEMVGYIDGAIASVEGFPHCEGEVRRLKDAILRAETVQAELARLGAEASQQVGTLERHVENFARDHGDQLSTTRIELGELVQRCDEQLNAFKSKISTDIALAGPIDYWEKKSKSHNRWFWGSLATFIILASVILGLVFLEGRSLMRDIAERQTIVAEQSTAGQPGQKQPDTLKSPPAILDFLRLGIITLGTTLGFWILRFNARVLLSNLHLREDALERVTMVKTFLSMLEANIGLKPEDITLALGSVFRPATSGLVKDDGVPPGIWDVVTRLKSGQP